MDLPNLSITDLDAVAVRLHRCAEEIDVQAARARLGASTTWRGAAADRHSARVTSHVAALESLADRLRDAATRVRFLGETARERVALIEGADVGTGRWWP